MDLDGIESLLAPVFGPLGLDRMLLDDAGRALVTASGAVLMERLVAPISGHPMAALLLRGARELGDRDGDGSTAYLLSVVAAIRSGRVEAERIGLPAMLRALTAVRHSLLPDILEAAGRPMRVSSDLRAGGPLDVLAAIGRTVFAGKLGPSTAAHLAPLLAEHALAAGPRARGAMAVVAGAGVTDSSLLPGLWLPEGPCTQGGTDAAGSAGPTVFVILACSLDGRGDETRGDGDDHDDDDDATRPRGRVRRGGHFHHGCDTSSDSDDGGEGGDAGGCDPRFAPGTVVASSAETAHTAWAAPECRARAWLTGARHHGVTLVLSRAVVSGQAAAWAASVGVTIVPLLPAADTTAVAMAAGIVALSTLSHACFGVPTLGTAHGGFVVARLAGHRGTLLRGVGPPGGPPARTLLLRSPSVAMGASYLTWSRRALRVMQRAIASGGEGGLTIAVEPGGCAMEATAGRVLTSLAGDVDHSCAVHPVPLPPECITLPTPSLAAALRVMASAAWAAPRALVSSAHRTSGASSSRGVHKSARGMLTTLAQLMSLGGRDDLGLVVTAIAPQRGCECAGRVLGAGADPLEHVGIGDDDAATLWVDAGPPPALVVAPPLEWGICAPAGVAGSRLLAVVDAAVAALRIAPGVHAARRPDDGPARGRHR